MEKITGIKIENPTYLGIDKNPLEELTPISKINIFVGANNSGKSRLIRMLFEKESYDVSIKGKNLEQENKIIKSFVDLIEKDFTQAQVTTVNSLSIDVIRNLRDLPIYFNTNVDAFDSFRTWFLKLSAFPRISSWVSAPNSSFNIETLQNNIINNSKPIINFLQNYPNDIGFQHLRKYYLPVLRGLRAISDNISDDFYKQKTVKDYFPNNAFDTNFVFTGLEFYKKIRELSLGKQNDRQLKTDYQEFLSATLFEGNKIELTPNESDQTVYVQIGEEEFPIHNLGDGIQSIIILTFLPFIIQEPVFFFIEEPELFLHPGMQRKIINFYSSNERNLNKHTFFLTTHSNHFLDLTIDYPNVSIFTLRKHIPDGTAKEKEPNFIVQSVNIGDHSSLECLGVRNSSVFLVNATIWVEGITDRKYLREMLRQYVDINKEEAGFLKIEEDVHYSFVEYGGSNITHWSFLDFEDNIAVETLCGQAFLIIDKDGEENKLERKEELKEKLDDRLQILDAREIENTLSSNVIRHVVAEYECQEDEKTEEALKRISECTYTDYKDRYLGEFIENELIIGEKKRKGSYQAKSGTISDKVTFCKKALPYIKYGELPEPTKELIIKIYQHIKDHNI